MWIIKFIKKMVLKTLNTKPMRMMTNSLQKNGFSETEARVILIAGLIIGLPTPIPLGSLIFSGATFTVAKILGIIGIVILLKKVLKLRKNIV